MLFIKKMEIISNTGVIYIIYVNLSIKLCIKKYASKNKMVPTEIYLLTAIDVIDDLENNLSASLNFLLRLSALLLVVLLLAKYLSQPLIMFPYTCVSSK